MRRVLIALLVLSLMAVIPSLVLAQTGAQPIVRAVLFYSPTCPHCHEVINNFLVPLVEERGSQLQIVGVDITQSAGQALYQAATERFQVPPERQGVPRLVVGDQVLVGSLEIPEQFPAILEAGLAAGGIDWPDIPGLAEAMTAGPSQTQAESTVPAGIAETPAATVEPTEAAQDTPTPASQPSPTPTEVVVQLNGDSLPPQDLGAASLATTEGAGLAAAVLGAMILALLFAAVRTVSARQWMFGNGNPTQLPQARSWLVPVLAILGLGVAAYLAFVEITQTEAVCGPVGQCNTVQSSQYASIAGIPVAVLGLLNYLAILVLWGLQFVSGGRWAGLAARALLALTVVGVLFSIYLTLLELFVIHAVCAWCLSSAIITTALLLVVVANLTRRSPSAQGPNRRQVAHA
jgi:uncharacterized membrane protein/thiol-disulfide isomerase/thioredoxin